jgi:hypothetical protein
VTLSLTQVALDGGLAEALLGLPAAAGVGQILGPGGKSLIIGRPANLRRWAASHLGSGKPRKKGARPPVDLRPVASAVAFTVSTSPFHQRLLFERLMAWYVAPSARRDLKPAAYLHVDLADRFPRLAVRSGLQDAPVSTLYGPFRDRAAADRARQALDKLHRTRPCDFAFEPDPALPLGLGCLYAQVGTCAAPCLARVSEAEYRSLARKAAALLASSDGRPPEIEALLRPWVAPAPALALIAERGSNGLELYPVRAAAVGEEGSVVQAPGEPLVAALGRVDWTGAADSHDDSPWLSSWLHAPRRRGVYAVIDGPPVAEHLVDRLRAAGLGHGATAVIT